MNPRSVGLVGFMGAGKTTVGQRLAPRLGLPFVDLDDRIVAAAGKTVPQIFEQDGEEAFRQFEREALSAVLGEAGCVLATGGGTIMDPTNRALLRAESRVAWLDIRFETARSRLLAEGIDRRPLIGHLGWEGLSRLHSQRRPDYAAAAHLRLECDRKSPLELARALTVFLAHSHVDESGETA